jgi:hypothetical protein
MTPHDTILISLPYPFKFLTLSRKIGFTFTNLAMYLFRESTGITTSKEYEQWVKDHGQPGFISEMLYHSARAYCLQNRKRENFTREGLKKAIALSDTEIQNKILNVWKASESFGATVKESKKKIVTVRPLSSRK